MTPPPQILKIKVQLLFIFSTARRFITSFSNTIKAYLQKICLCISAHNTFIRFKYKMKINQIFFKKKKKIILKQHKQSKTTQWTVKLKRLSGKRTGRACSLDQQVFAAWREEIREAPQNVTATQDKDPQSIMAVLVTNTATKVDKHSGPLVPES